MNKTGFSISILLIITAGLGVYFLTWPLYEDLQRAQTENQEFDQVLSEVSDLLSVQESLIGRYQNMPSSDREAVDAVMADENDNVRLIYDIEQLALQHGLLIIKASSELLQDNNNQQNFDNADEEIDTNGPREKNTLMIEITVGGEYDGFVSFLSDLERSLRIIDVKSVEFTPASDRTTYSYELILHSYILR